jgi:RNA polymerase sigma-70 factor, ECF subfamily
MQAIPPPADERNAEFMRLFVQYQRRVHAFIVTLLPNLADAEDVLQETSLTAWQKFDDFQSGTDFVRWVCTIARFKVLKFRRQQKSGRLLFSDALLEDLADQQIRQSDAWEHWNQTLADCMAKLRPNDRELFLHCSRSDTTTKQVADRMGRPVNTVYKAINRIRKDLIGCIRHAVSREGHQR